MWSKEVIINRTKALLYFWKWNLKGLPDRIKQGLRFWIPLLMGGLLIFGIVIVISAEWRQTSLQEETLIETKIVTQNQEMLKILKINGEKAGAILVHVERQQEEFNELIREIKKVTADIIANQEQLRVDRKEREVKTTGLMEEAKESAQATEKATQEFRDNWTRLLQNQQEFRAYYIEMRQAMIEAQKDLAEIKKELLKGKR